MPRPIIPPGHCHTPEDRTAYFYRAQEKLRKEHNRMGEKYRTGQITQQAWLTYLLDQFDPAHRDIVAGILAARAHLKTQPTWDPEIPIP